MGESKVLTADVRDRILELLCDGQTLVLACRELGVSHRAVHRLIETDRTYAAAYARARALGWDVMAEDLAHIHERIDHPAAARLASENRRWLLARVKPETYGDKLDIQMTQTIDVGDALLAGRERVSRLTIESKPVDGDAHAGDQAAPAMDPALLELLD